MWLDNYITMNELFGTLANKKNSDLMEQLVMACREAMTDYKEELHDTKIVTSIVLELLGEKWVKELEWRTQKEYTSAVIRTLPIRQRDKTRLLKYTIRELLQAMYENNPRYKYYLKYNSRSPNAYQVWKDTEFKKKRI